MNKRDLDSSIPVSRDTYHDGRRNAATKDPAKIGSMKYRVYLERDEDGTFVVNCPTLPGCISQGQTRAEATANIREAIEGYLKSLAKHGDPVPPGIEEEVIEVTNR